MTIKKQNIFNINIILFMFYAFFYSIMEAVLDAKVRFVCLFAMGFLMILLTVKKKFYLTKKSIGWFLFSLIVLVNNQAIFHGNILTSTQIILGLVFIIFVGVYEKTDWCIKVKNAFIVMGIVHMLASLFFMLFPNTYPKFAWGVLHTYPAGTENGLYGHRAGLSVHYSLNSIYLAILLMVIGGIILSGSCVEKHRKRLNILFILAIFFSLMTTKRGPLFFSIMALVIMYLFLNRREKMLGYFKVFGIFLITGVGLVILSFFVPQVRIVFDRILNMGGSTDTSVNARLAMWALAFSKFLESPLLGIGWFGFRYQYAIYLFNPSNPNNNYLDTHNIYLQLLCETGVVGIALFLALSISSIVSILCLLRNAYKWNLNKDEYQIAIIAAIIQIYIMLYGMTGNCIYDITLIFYAIAVTMGYSIERNVKKRCN